MNRTSRGVIHSLLRISVLTAISLIILFCGKYFLVQPQDKATEVSKVTTGIEENVLLNTSGKTVIRRINGPFEYSHPYIIISKNGTVALLDPYKVPKDIDADIATISHTHYDHIDKSFLKTTNSRVSNMTNESFEVKDIKVTGIPASHGGNDIDVNNPDDFIYLYEVDGLRIAHFGDCGQDTLTEEQIKALGKIDVAIMIFLEYPSTGNYIEKSCRLMEQLKPTIILSHEYSAEGLARIGEIVGNYEKIDNELVLSKEDLENTKRRVIELNYIKPE